MFNQVVESWGWKNREVEVVVVAGMGPVRSGSARIRNPSRRVSAVFSKSIRLRSTGRGLDGTIQGPAQVPYGTVIVRKARGEEEGKVGNGRGKHDGRQ